MGMFSSDDESEPYSYARDQKEEKLKQTIEQQAARIKELEGKIYRLLKPITNEELKIATDIWDEFDSTIQDTLDAILNNFMNKRAGV